jgi:hypothetical protein
MMDNARRIFREARGKFIASCEGDDYWCSKDKLQRQVALICNDERIGIVHSDWVRAQKHGSDWIYKLDSSVHRRVPQRLLAGNIFSTWHFPRILRTCTVLLRRELMQAMFDSPLGQKTYRFGDSVLSSFITSRSRVAYLPEVTAVYRESQNSILRSGAKSRVNFYKSCLEFDTDARIYFVGTSEYPAGYRWEATVALFLWSLRAKDFVSARFAVRDICSHFGFIDFLRVGIKTTLMRWPTLRKQARIIPNMRAKAAQQRSADA